VITHVQNPDAYETIAKQLEAEAEAHEESARTCRREAAKSHMKAWYYRVVAQLPSVK
jgi:hypothetical protein